MVEVENKVLIDGYWKTFDENLWEEQDEIEREIADAEYDEEAAYVATHGWGRANGYCL